MERHRSNLPWTMVFGALALFAGLALAGIPLGSLLVLGLVLTCPLLMAGMHMGASHGQHSSPGGGEPHGETRTESPARADPARTAAHQGTPE